MDQNLQQDDYLWPSPGKKITESEVKKSHFEATATNLPTVAQLLQHCPETERDIATQERKKRNAM